MKGKDCKKWKRRVRLGIQKQVAERKSGDRDREAKGKTADARGIKGGCRQGESERDDKGIGEG